MEKPTTFLAILMLSSVISFSQFQIDWQQCYGGMGVDHAYDIAKIEGGYLVTGFTNSNNGLVNCNVNDYGLNWLIKLNNSGDLLWQKCYEYTDAFRMVKAIGSSHYYLIGGSWSDDDPFPGTYNLGIKKIDTLGNIIWERALGNSIGILGGDQYGEPTADGGVIATAQIDSQGGDITTWYGGYDGWIVKLDSLGNKEWDFSVGTSQFEFINGIIQTSDEGYLAGLYGTPNGIGGNVDCDIQSLTIPDVIIFKLDTYGNPEWHHCYGGSGHEGVVRLLETADGYLVAAFGGSADGDLTGSGWHGESDVWLIRTDFSGNIIWQKCYGGSNSDSPKKIFQTSDGGFIVFANTDSFDGDVVGNPSSGNEPSIWIFKVDSLGELLWQQCIGGGRAERVYGVVQNSDYNYTVAGEMFYSPSGDVNCSNFVYGSQRNYWVFSISDTTVNVVENFQESIIVKVYPNPANSVLNIDFPLDYDTKNIKIEIVDINGRTMLKSERVSISTQLEIKLLNNGLYLIKIQNGNTLITKKIIIQ